MPKIQRVKAGDPISATQFNLLIDELERLGKWAVFAPLDLKNTPAGFAMTVLGFGADAVTPVKCTQTGGSAGDDSVECSFTYTIKTLDDTRTIATGVACIGHRSLKVTMTAATYGLAAKDSTGVWKLFWTDERQAQQTGCSAP